MRCAAFWTDRAPCRSNCSTWSRPSRDPERRRRRVVHAAVDANSELTAALRQPREKQELFLPLAEWIRDRRAHGQRVLITCQTKSQAQRLAALLEPYGLHFTLADGFPATAAEPGAAFICLGRVSSGFVWPAERLAVLSDEEIFGVRHLRRAQPAAKARTQLLNLQELKQGDLIVHDEHGIGQYDGLQKLTVEGVRNDFLVLRYHGGDKLYLPVDRMGMVQKYMGVEGHGPALDKLGGKSWERVKARVKRSAEKIAGELLRLYAQRKVAGGFAFPAADGYFRDFETGFAYEETPDQLKAIDDVLADMQQTVPMDRLVCGDVGYGKTEVALRASFLAACSGKQAAILVPTTILAEQHYATFRSRFQRYPVNVACLSRFRSRPEQQAILAGLKSGAIDIVIGTHRLIQKDVAFKDLGLLVLDEEQRFGVRHKEKLKSLRASVDVLALTATPIPRTLHLSLAGVRDISLIQTPPEYRKSIITYICEFDHECGGRGHPPRAAAAGPDLLRPQQYSQHPRDGRQAQGAGPRGPARCGPRPHGGRRAGAGHGPFSESGHRHAGVHHHHRVRPRHPLGQHDDRRPGGLLRAVPDVPAAGPGGPGGRAGLCLPAHPGREPAHGRRPQAAEGPHGAQRSGGRLPDRHERSRDPRRRDDPGRLPVGAHRGRRL